MFLVALEDACNVKSQQFRFHVSGFYGTETEYITESIHPLNDLKWMSEVAFRKSHTRENVRKIFEFIIT
jgi:hypothetical protein